MINNYFNIILIMEKILTNHILKGPNWLEEVNNLI
jgi:hypothetical protein